jgi:hypothetical protein
MSVINCKVSNIRPKYNNLKELLEDENNIYIGRRGIVFVDGERYPKSDSIFANPYKVGKDGTRDEVIEKYKIYFYDKIRSNPTFWKDEFVKLKGKNLCCWCHPERCHGDVILELLNYNIKIGII